MISLIKDEYLLSKVKSRIPVSHLRFIAEDILKIPFAEFVSGRSISYENESKLKNILTEIKTGRPLEYILGRSGFFGLDLDIDENTLIPRKETEILVEEVLKSLGDEDTILDIGTGSGNIAVSLSLAKKRAKVFSVDISYPAIKTAVRNKGKYNTGNLFFVNSSLMNCFASGSFDIIVSNPPYVEDSYIDNDSRLRCEPRPALSGGPDGLDVIRNILKEAKSCLKKRGLLFLEIGFQQKDKVLKIADKNGWKVKAVVKDYSGIDRVLSFSRIGE